MNRFSQLSSLLLATVLFTSCNKQLAGSGNLVTENRQTAGFTGIENFGDFKVIVNKGATINMSLYGEDNVLGEIVTEVNNNKLKIRYRNNHYRHRHKQVIITLTTPELSLVSLNGSGSIESTANWSGTDLVIDISGSGNIDLFTTSSYLETSVGGSGDITLHGEAEKSAFAISGSGKIKAYDATTAKAYTTISGSVSAQITVSEKLDAKINESGTVYYKGNPQTVNTSISGSGKVIKQ